MNNTSIFTKSLELNRKMINSHYFDWKHFSPDLLLIPGEIHIWMTELDRLVLNNKCKESLSSDEQIRAKRLIGNEKRNEFQNARFILRNILSFYSHQPPTTIRFDYGPNGKPILAPSNQVNNIEFNISHSNKLMIAAFTRFIPVGIDLETIRSVHSKDWIVNNYFSENDKDLYKGLSESQKKIAFITAWTKKESFGKAIGTGFSSEFQKDHFDQELAELLLPNFYEISHSDNIWYLRFAPQKNYTSNLAILSKKMLKPIFIKSNSELYQN